MPWLSQTYISQVLERDFRAEEYKTSGETRRKSTSRDRVPALYISHPHFSRPFSSAWTIILSAHIPFAFSTMAWFNTSILFSSISLPPSHPFSLFLPGGEHNLISQCCMRRPLLSGSRWWKIRPFGLSSFCIHTALLAAREHQITLNLGSPTPLILNGRLI